MQTVSKPMLFANKESAKVIMDELAEQGKEDVQIRPYNCVSFGQSQSQIKFCLVREVPSIEPLTNLKSILILRVDDTWK